MKQRNLIEDAEKKYLNLLEEFFIEKWGDTKLWSHDLSHHRRVWNYAKELMQYLTVTEQLFADKLMIACYLHDIGMAIDQREKHGIHSRKFCESFLKIKDINPADYADLLEAIENHDNKEDKVNQQDNRLLLYLTVADDLDAFGCTGILRYADIYMQRGVSQGDLGRLVLENSGKRFRNFEKAFMGIPELVDRHRNRYRILHEFYSAFNQNQ